MLGPQSMKISCLVGGIDKCKINGGGVPFTGPASLDAEAFKSSNCIELLISQLILLVVNIVANRLDTDNWFFSQRAEVLLKRHHGQSIHLTIIYIHRFCKFL